MDTAKQNNADMKPEDEETRMMTQDNLPATETAGGAVARPDDYNPYLACAKQFCGSEFTFLKFKRGHYYAGPDEDEVPLSTRLVANMREEKFGLRRWWDGQMTEEVMVLARDNMKPPNRSELGDTDRSLWETNDHGEPRDPWQFTHTLPLKSAETGEDYLFTTSSNGGIKAMGKLLKAYGTEYRQKPGKVPVIELQADDYAHSNKAYGRIDVPVLPLVDWVDEAELITAEKAGDEPEKTADATEQASKSGAGHPTKF